ncbi:MAG: AsmA family protein [Oceanospirillaceae bacterium]
MKKIIKILASLIAVVVILLLAGGTLLGLFIDPNDYKDEIEQAALENADLKLKIDGTIEWSIYPSIGLNITKIQAGYPGKDTFASLDNAQVSVMLIPLLASEVKMKTITITGLDLNLVQGEKSNNWQVQNSDAKAENETTSATTEPDNAAQDSDGTLDIDVESIIIRDAKITYTDATTGDSTSISALNLTTDRVVLGKAFNAQLDFTAQVVKASKTVLKSSAKISANFNIDHINQRFKISQLVTQLSITADQQIDLQLKADLDADMAASLIRVDNLQLQSFGLDASGEIIAQGADFSDISGNLNIAQFDLKALIAKLTLPPIITSDDNSLRKVAFSTQIKGNLKQLNFDKLVLTVDDTKIAGSASYSLASTLASFNLTGDKLNINSYLPSPANNAAAQTSSTKTTAEKPASTGYSKDIIIPIEPLKSLKLTGKLRFKQLTFQKTAISNLELNIDANNGLVKIPKLNLNVYGGNLSNNITLDARKETLKLSINNKINKLNIGPLLTDFANTDMLTGTLVSSSALTARGQSLHSIINTLNGKTQLSLANGVIKGINAAQKMCETINKISSLGGTVATTQSVDQSTPFATIKGKLNFKNGVMSNKDFTAKLDALDIAGKGSVDLAKQALDYRVGLKIQENLFKKSCSVNNKIQGVEWPIDCKGNFSDDPLKLCKPDLSVVKDLLKNALKEKLSKKLEAKLGGSVKEKKQEIKNKLEDKLKGALKGLF